MSRFSSLYSGYVGECRSSELYTGVLEKVRVDLEEIGKFSNKDLFEKTPSLQKEPKEEVKTGSVRGREHGLTTLTAG